MKDNAIDGTVGRGSNVEKVLALLGIEIAAIDNGTLALSQDSTGQVFAASAGTQLILIDAYVHPGFARDQGLCKSRLARPRNASQEEHELRKVTVGIVGRNKGNLRSALLLCMIILVLATFSSALTNIRSLWHCFPPSIVFVGLLS